jgi:ADP-ribose pyrophosphatase YjhB (NUDIX family)
MLPTAIRFQDPQLLENIRSQVAAHTSRDPYGNCHIDLTDSPELQDKVQARAFKQLLPELIEDARTHGTHTLTVKFSSQCSRLYKYVQQAGLHFHFADRNKALAKICLQGHREEECTYPKYKTLSVGVTSVVFNENLTRFVAVQEKMGPYLGPKAVTGTVDYEKSETPLQAAEREVLEETGLQVSSATGVFVGQVWTPNLRDGKPDENLVFAFQVQQEAQPLKAQEEEIRLVEWLSVNDFLTMRLPVKHSKPLILQRVVEAAQRVLQMNPNGHIQKLAWGSGKDAEFYSSTQL